MVSFLTGEGQQVRVRISLKHVPLRLVALITSQHLKIDTLVSVLDSQGCDLV